MLAWASKIKVKRSLHMISSLLPLLLKRILLYSRLCVCTCTHSTWKVKYNICFKTSGKRAKNLQLEAPTSVQWMVVSRGRCMTISYVFFRLGFSSSSFTASSTITTLAIGFPVAGRWSSWGNQKWIFSFRM